MIDVYTKNICYDLSTAGHMWPNDRFIGQYDSTLWSVFVYTINILHVENHNYMSSIYYVQFNILNQTFTKNPITK